MSGTVSPTGDGFLVGTDAPTAPVTQEELAAMQAQQPPVNITLQQQPNQTGPLYTAEDLERVRAEEKEKLYARLNGKDSELKDIQERMAAWEKEKADLAAAEQKAKEEAEAVRKAKEEEQMELRDLLERRDAENKARLDEMNSRFEQERAVFEQERRFNELQEYRRSMVEQHGEFIMPELRDYVRGDSVEEIDASIADLRARTEAIMANVRENLTAPPAPPMRGTSTTTPPVGPLEQEPGNQSFSPQDIRNMTPQQYAKHREGLLQAAQQSYRGF